MPTTASPGPASLVPAQLGFLAIYNPSLSATDDTLDDQIVYYASVNTQSQKRRNRTRGKPTDDLSQDERNERLRQIGLAQGMVDFSRGFADGKPVDTIETEKSRVVLHELEPGWWMLASIDLTKVPLPPRLAASTPPKDDADDNFEYTSRELKSASLLTQDLLRAHSVFLLHHGASLSALFVRSRRTKFVSLLGRYWDLFLSTWDVMLHGNPACGVFGGIKIAACGELGVGVGEEERGSGEREVLEGFANRVEGLVDLVVSKFGSFDPDSDLDPAKGRSSDDGPPPRWLGTGAEPGAEDGAIFLGVGALSRKSVRDITYWMEDIYTWGEDAYGVKESPTSTRQIRRPRRGSKDASALFASHNTRDGPSEPTPKSTVDQGSKSIRAETASASQAEAVGDEGGMNKIKNYLKMGYGTHWTLGSSGGAEDATPSNEPTHLIPPKDKTSSGDSRRHSAVSRNSAVSDVSGHYLIGLMGDIDASDSSEHEECADLPAGVFHDVEYNSRVLLRTVTAEFNSAEQAEADISQDFGSQGTELTTTISGDKDAMDPNSNFASQDRNKSTKMRVVVYVCKPFVYTFLFRNRTDSLAWDGFYKSLHHQLAPLRKPLGASTAYRPLRPEAGAAGATSTSHIFDLVWDPRALTIHSTIPNIPTPAEVLQLQGQGQGDPAPQSLHWSRAEAVNSHNQILNTYAAALTDYSRLERTCKTSRGWWVVWTRIMEDAVPPVIAGAGAGSSPPEELTMSKQASSGSGSADAAAAPPQAPRRPSLEPRDSAFSNRGPGPTSLPPKPKVSKEIFLIRRAGEHSSSGFKGVGGGGSYTETVPGGGGGGGGGGWVEGASRLAQGIGVDTTKYIEGLLSLTR
ncbi:hypothetical protein GGR56DRAFT_586869 [Xylariaceae sp. FL0804]|nr:hypothetical protein GGR56DRAFT_586869 [Xylariaceae sp. FL0804]